MRERERGGVCMESEKECVCLCGWVGVGETDWEKIGILVFNRCVDNQSWIVAMTKRLERNIIILLCDKKCRIIFEIKNGEWDYKDERILGKNPKLLGEK